MTGLKDKKNKQLVNANNGNNRELNWNEIWWEKFENFVILLICSVRFGNTPSRNECNSTAARVIRNFSLQCADSIWSSSILHWLDSPNPAGSIQLVPSNAANSKIFRSTKGHWHWRTAGKTKDDHCKQNESHCNEGIRWQIIGGTSTRILQQQQSDLIEEGWPRLERFQ